MVKLLSEQNKDIIYAPGNNALHYRGGLYTKNNHYESNGNGYGYCNFLRISKDGKNFLRISKDGKNAVVLQSADSSHYGDLSNSANKIYTDLFEK